MTDNRSEGCFSDRMKCIRDWAELLFFVVSIAAIVAGLLASLLGPSALKTYFLSNDLHWVWISVDLANVNWTWFAAIGAAIGITLLGALFFPLLVDLGVSISLFERASIDVSTLQGWRRFTDVALYLLPAIAFVVFSIFLVKYAVPVFIGVAAIAAFIDSWVKYKAKLLGRARKISTASLLHLGFKHGESSEAQRMPDAFLYGAGRWFATVAMLLPFVLLLRYVAVVTDGWEGWAQWLVFGVSVVLLAAVYGLVNLRGVLAIALILPAAFYAAATTLPAGTWSTAIVEQLGFGGYTAKIECLESPRCEKMVEELGGDPVYVAWSFDGAYAVLSRDESSKGFWLSKEQARVIRSQSDQNAGDEPNE